MLKFTRSRLAAVAVAAAIVGGSVFAASPAYAGSCTNVAGILLCGRVSVAAGSIGYVRVGADWNGSYPTGTLKNLSAGMSSSSYIKDVDAFFIPSGYCGTLVSSASAPTKFPANRWHKITDLTNIQIKVSQPAC
jgi:hypothetical protein